MPEDLKSKIYRLLDTIEDETVLQMVAEDITYYAGKKDIVDDLDTNQVQELNEALEEADNNETIEWNDFVKELK